MIRLIQENKETIYLIMIFFLMFIGILLKSYFHPNGYISPDSSKYLQLAQNLLEGKGFYVTANGVTGNEREFFAIWPVGYPTLIYLVAKLTGLSVFWASKMLNILFVATILYVFKLIFKKNAYVYALIMFFGSYITIFSYTWSETAFITFSLLFSVLLHLIITKPKPKQYVYIFLLFSSLALFSSRYIGAFSFGLIGMLGVYFFLKRESSKGVKLMFIASINIIIMCLYLYHNYISTGFKTGMPRIPAPESILYLSKNLFISFLNELSIVFSITGLYNTLFSLFIQLSILIALLFYFRKYNKDKHPRNSLTFSYVFVTVGFFSLLSIITMRFLTHFDTFTYRLLAPGNFFVFIALIYFIQHKMTANVFNAVKAFIVVFALLSYLYNVPYRVFKNIESNQSYYKTINTIKSNLKGVEKNSIIVFGNIHITYLYPDISRVAPYSFPYSAKSETWADFLSRVDTKNKPIYLYGTSRKINQSRYDKSVVDIVKHYDLKEGKVVRIK